MGYKSSIMLKVAFIVALVLAIIIMAGFSCTISGRDMTIMEGLETIWNHIIGIEPERGTSEWLDDFIVWSVSMPRVTYAIIAGAGLGLCGAMMQGVMNNPLADPYTVGVSSGAVFGAVLVIVLGISAIPGVGDLGVIANAFLFGFLPVLLVLFLSKTTQTLSPVVIILAGTAISYFFSGLTTIIMVNADEDSLSEAYLWQIGSLDAVTWDQIPLVLAVVALGSIVALLSIKKLNAMSMGDNYAKTLGTNVENFRLLTLVMVTLIAASIISFTGVIGFVGLVAPHMMRMILGGNNKFVIPASLLAGAAILLFADTVTRGIMSIDLPVGAVMSFIGAPIFLYLMVGRKKGAAFRWMRKPNTLTTI